MAFVPFVGTKLKIIRAYDHLKALNAEIDAALAGQPNAVIGQIEPETGDKVYRAQITWQPPREWGLLLGDCVHNLRSALDHMVWDLVLLNGGTPDSNTEFPIYWDGTKYGLKGQAERKLKGVSAQATDLIEQSQPYHAPVPCSHPLWVLHELDVIDKHHSILLTASIANLRFVGHYGDLPEPLEFGGSAFEDQDEILRIPASSYAKGDLYPKFTCDVAMDVTGPRPGQPLREVVSNLYGMVSTDLHYMEYKVLGTSPFSGGTYPHLSDTAPPSARPPECRVVEPA
jgi:hypothetical protein